MILRTENFCSVSENINTAITKPFSPAELTARVEFAPGLTERGQMICESCTFLDLVYGRGFWVCEPGEAPESRLENTIVFHFTYADSENSADFLEVYYILRPWGMLWDDVREADTAGMIYEDMMPLLYEDWYLVQLQQELAAAQNVVMDGRDIGTVVLPDARGKIYLTASVEVRARRRFLEMKEKGEPADFDQIAAEIAERDHRDMTREVSPLRQADDAVLVDTSDMTIDQVTQRILEIVKERTGLA